MVADMAAAGSTAAAEAFTVVAVASTAVAAFMAVVVSTAEVFMAVVVSTAEVFMAAAFMRSMVAEADGTAAERTSQAVASIITVASSTIIIAISLSAAATTRIIPATTTPIIIIGVAGSCGPITACTASAGTTVTIGITTERESRPDMTKGASSALLILKML
jgi:hypothetical protein